MARVVTCAAASVARTVMASVPTAGTSTSSRSAAATVAPAVICQVNGASPPPASA
jgi:hypothetical protein